MGSSEDLAARGFRFFLLLLVVSGLGFGFAKFRSRRPPPSSLNPALQPEPVQTTTTSKSFSVERQGSRYDLLPVFDYEIHGLIVTDHDSASWLDLSHAMWKDFLNTKDICVVWGENVKMGRLGELKFSSGDWTCWVETRSQAAWSAFKMHQISNNHVLPATAEVDALIRGAAVGDEIRMKGQLVNYNVNGGPMRVTSTTRADTGNGACEILYVTEFEILARHNLKWLNLIKMFRFLMIGSFLGILLSLFVLPRFQ